MRIFFKRGHLCYSSLAALALVSIEVTPWALILSSILILLRYGVEKSWWKPLSPFLVNMLSVLAMVLVFLQFRTFLGQDSSSTLLVLLCALRILDFRSLRDERLLILLGFVLVSLKFLFSVDLYWLPAGVAVFFGLWRSLLPADMEAPWKFTLSSAVKAFPVVLILFFIFPRVQVPWIRPSNHNIPITGMSESISPGEISNLSLNRQTAFRAEFTGYRPPMRDLYWRGAVLEDGAGFYWQKTKEAINETQMPRDEINFDYIITLEPSELRVLPVLEHTRYISSPMVRAFKTDRGTYRTPGAILSRIQYRGFSTETWRGVTVENETPLPELPQKTAKWVHDIKKQNLDYFDKMKALKKLFTENKFFYSRSPGTYNNLDEFLFDRREGFCEHYAGSYATLAKAIGITARVITGYQGGEWNEAGQFYRIAHADAHAWVEVRDPQGSWRRIDPTFWVAPLRIDLGGIAYFQLSPDDLSLSAGSALEKLRGSGWTSRVWTTAQYHVENLNYRWTQTILNFDMGEQKRIFDLLIPQIGWWLTAIIGVLLLFLLLRKTLFMKKSNFNPATENFLWLESRFERLGFRRELSEPPIAFLEKIKKQRPQDSMLVTKTIQLYRYERYRERKSGPDDWSRLKRAWKKSLSQKPEKLRNQAS